MTAPPSERPLPPRFRWEAGDTEDRPTTAVERLSARLGVLKHSPGGHSHDQSRHGRGGGGSVSPDELRAAKLWVDNPKLRQEDSKWADVWLADNRNTPTAGFWAAPVDPAKVVAEFPGRMGEERHIDQEKVARLAASMKRDGFHPEKPINLEVDADGKFWVYEGNHRLRAANEAGLKSIPATVLFLGGGDMKVTPQEFADRFFARDTVAKAALLKHSPGGHSHDQLRHNGTGERREGPWRVFRDPETNEVVNQYPERGAPHAQVRAFLKEHGVEHEADGAKIQLNPSPDFVLFAPRPGIYCAKIEELTSPGRGTGAIRLMRRVTDMADKHGIPLHLLASPFPSANPRPMRLEKLIKFYEHFGFREARPGVRGTLSGGADMYRAPGAVAKALVSDEELLDLFFDDEPVAKHSPGGHSHRQLDHGHRSNQETGQALAQVRENEALQKLGPEGVAQFERELAEVMAKPDTAVCVKIPNEKLDEVLNQGRVKTAWETRKDERAYLTTREEVEAMNGLGKDTVYGYVDESVSGYGRGHVPTAVYGNSILVLKPEVKGRTSITVGDSFSAAFSEGNPDAVVASPMLKPGMRSIPRRTMADPGGGKDLFRNVRNGDIDYVEAQIKGGVKRSDIARIIVDGVTSPEEGDSLRALGAKHNIPLEIVD